LLKADARPALEDEVSRMLRFYGIDARTARAWAREYLADKSESAES